MSVQNLKKIEKIKAKYINGQIVPEESYESVFAKVTDDSIVVLKDVFPSDEIENIRHLVHQWGQMTPVTNPPKPTTSWHRLDDNPPQSKTPHRFIGYMFLADEKEDLIIDQNGQDLGLHKKLMPYFKALGEFQSKLTNTKMTFTSTGQGHKLSPQIIHYPFAISVLLNAALVRATREFIPRPRPMLVGKACLPKQTSKRVKYFPKITWRSSVQLQASKLGF